MGTSLAGRVGPIIGAFYVAIGIIGFFFTGFGNFLSNTPDSLLGFSINPMHNLVHLLIGAFLILMTTRSSTPTAEGAMMGVGLFYVVAFVIGVLAPDNLTILSMTGAGDLENFNHLVNGVLLLVTGLLSSARTQQGQMRQQGLA